MGESIRKNCCRFAILTNLNEGMSHTNSEPKILSYYLCMGVHIFLPQMSGSMLQHSELRYRPSENDFICNANLEDGNIFFSDFTHIPPEQRSGTCTEVTLHLTIHEYDLVW